MLDRGSEFESPSSTAFNKDFAVSDQEGISQVLRVDKIEDDVSSGYDDTTHARF